jgi:hypothetical protein
MEVASRRLGKGIRLRLNGLGCFLAVFLDEEFHRLQMVRSGSYALRACLDVVGRW